MCRRKWIHMNVNQWKYDMWPGMTGWPCCQRSMQMQHRTASPQNARRKRKTLLILLHSVSLITSIHSGVSSGTLAVGRLGRPGISCKNQGTSSTKTHQEQLSLWRGELAYVLPLCLQHGAKCRVMTAFSPTQNGISNTILRSYKKLWPSTDLFIQIQTPGKKRLRNNFFFFGKLQWVWVPR